MNESLERPDNTDTPASAVGFESRAILPFPVVAIGASAGGVEALQAFFGAASNKSGMAYIVVQHLSPEHQSVMAEILGRHTRMPVVQITDGLAIAPDHVYVIAPGFTLTLSNGRLNLGEPIEKRGHRRPVDDFFRSLAREQKEKAVAVILSGTGTNGTAGAQAIKAAGGICIAQNPETAAFPGMPRSLIHAGYADQVLEAGDIPPIIERYVRTPYLGTDLDARAAEDELQRDRAHLREVLALVRSRTRHDFSGYRKPTLLRRIQRRMGLAAISSIAEYGQLLREHPEEAVALANDLMINVTGFFRDPEAWEELRNAVITPLVASRRDGATLRVWVTACASGEEAYTTAMLIADELKAQGHGSTLVKIFATDTADKSLELARAGVYPGGIESDIAPDRLDRFFDKDEHTYRVKKSIRDMVVFAPQDALRDPPFSRVDLCTCRNFLIYLEPETQRRVMALLHFSLQDGGYLFLGNTESVGTGREFEVISKKWRIYRRIGPSQHRFGDIPSFATIPRRDEAAQAGIGDVLAAAPPRANPTMAVQRMLLELYEPPTIVADRSDQVCYFHGDLKPFLQLPSGEPTRDVIAMIQPALRVAVRTVLRNALREGRTTQASAELTQPDGNVQQFEVEAVPLPPGKPLAEYFAVRFLGASPDQRAAAAEPAQRRESAGEYQAPPHTGEMRALQLELQNTIEAFEATSEELKASNEEATSINEELQSTNEELETGKEELQSVNEELSTVNNQLQAKLGQLEAATNDLTNLLSSTDIAVVFLDEDFRVRQFTPALRDLLELLESDLGRPLTNFAKKFKDEYLLTDARQVLSRLIPIEREIESDSGRWYLRRALPYRTTENRIEGVVITFVDVSARKHAEQELMHSRARLLDVMDIAIVLMDANGVIMHWNKGAESLLGWSPDEAVGKSIDFVFLPEERLAGAASRELHQARETGRSVDDGWLLRKDGSRVWVTGILASISPQGTSQSFIKFMRDANEAKHIQDQLRVISMAAERAQADAFHANRLKEDFLSTVSHELRTPLNTIKLWANMFKSDKLKPERFAEGVRMVERAADAQERLINDLLDVSRINTGQLRLALQDVRFGPTLSDAVAAIRPVSEARGVAVRADISPLIGITRADPDRIQQVVWNLLSNAVKFTPSGGWVNLSAGREGDDVKIIVADSGIGIRAEFLPHIFERFRQAEAGTSRTHGGLGLGLAIAKQLVEMHRGNLTVASEGIGKGTVFSVTLPLPERGLELSDFGPPGAEGSLALSGMDILVVEDEADAGDTIRGLLEGYGAQVRLVSSAGAAREALAIKRPNVILSDIGLPGEDGYSLMRSLLPQIAQSGQAGIPTVAITAFARPDDRDAALAAGFTEHLSKPLQADQLLQVLAALVGRATGDA